MVKFQVVTALLVLSSFRYILLYYLVYWVLERHAVCVVALLQWALHLVLYTWFTHGRRLAYRPWTRRTLHWWIGTNVSFYVLALAIDAVLYHLFQRQRQALAQQVLDPTGFFTNASGSLPDQWHGVAHVGGAYVAWTLVESLVLRTLSIYYAVALLRVRTRTGRRRVEKGGDGDDDGDRGRPAPLFVLRNAGLAVRFAWVAAGLLLTLVLGSAFTMVRPSPCALAVPANRLAVGDAGRGTGSPDTFRPAACFTGCEPLAVDQCLMPFPSDHFLDPAARRMRIPAGAMPKLRTSGQQMDVGVWNRMDGWSTSTPIMFQLPPARRDGGGGGGGGGGSGGGGGGDKQGSGVRRVSVQGTPDKDSVSMFADAAVKIVLVDADRNERVPYWVDWEFFAEQARDDPANDLPVVLVHPAVPLRYATRYVVGVRRLTTTTEAAADASHAGTDRQQPVAFAPASAALAALVADRYDPSNGHNVTRGRWARYRDAVLPVLRTQGFQRDQLQLAWEFTTRTYEGGAGDVARAFADGVARMQRSLATTATAGVPDYAYRIRAVEPEQCSGPETGTRGRAVHGTFLVPSYLVTDNHQRRRRRRRRRDQASTEPEDEDDEDDEGEQRLKFLARAANGTIAYAGRTDRVPFTVYVTCRVLLAPSEPAHIVQYGHSVFSQRREFLARPLRTAIDSRHWIVFGIEWPGVNQFDVIRVARGTLSDVPHVASSPEMVVQGLINQGCALETVMAPVFQTDPAFALHRAQSWAPARAATSVFARARLAGYWGNSLGAIIGGAYATVSPRIRRAALVSGGAPYMLLTPHSQEYRDLLRRLLIPNFYSNSALHSTFGLFQMIWDQSEGGGWLPLYQYPPPPPPAASLSSSASASAPVDVRYKQFLLQDVVNDGTVSDTSAQFMARAVRARGTRPMLRPVFGVSEAAAATPSASYFTEFRYAENATGPGTHLHTALRFNAAALRQVSGFLERGPGDGASACTSGQGEAVPCDRQSSQPQTTTGTL